MANRWGGQLLAEVLAILQKHKVFEDIGQPRSQALVTEVVQLASNRFDCVGPQILDEIGPALGMCRICGSPTASLKKGACEACWVVMRRDRARLALEEEEGR